MIKLKGELLWVQQMATTLEDLVISIPKLVGHFILLDLYDISLIIKNVFISRHGSHFISFPLIDMPTIYKCQRCLTYLPYRSMDGGSFTELNILILVCFQIWPGAITCITSKRKPMCVLYISFTRHCFTASEPVQYPSEVALVPCKHSYIASGPI